MNDRAQHNPVLPGLPDEATGRRAFFSRALGAAAVGGAMLALPRAAGAQTTSPSPTPTPTPSPTPSPSSTTSLALTDLDLVNFSLNLEYLAANFYAFATTGAAIGSTLTSGSVGTAGTASGGRAVSFADPIVAQFAKELAAKRLAHVTFLRTLMSSTNIAAQPAIDLGTGTSGAFSTAFRNAGLIGAADSFDPYASDANFLLAAFLIEDVTVTAYKGIAAQIGNAALLESAAGLLATSAQLAALVRTTLYRKGRETPALRLIEATEALSALRDRLDGAPAADDLWYAIAADDDQGVAATADAAGRTVANIVPANANGLVYRRTPPQVLNIFYLNAGVATSGGFFPAGINTATTIASGSGS